MATRPPRNYNARRAKRERPLLQDVSFSIIERQNAHAAWRLLRNLVLARAPSSFEPDNYAQRAPADTEIPEH